MKTIRHLCPFLCAALLGASASAEVKLPAIFSDHMVLQCDTAVPVWGWADAGEQVTVSIAGQTKTATADASGKWSVKLDKLPAGDALTLTVKGKNTITVSDVLVGEVWLCSGQSNMAMTVNRAKDFEQEKSAANFPQIRMFTVTSGASTTPQEKCEGRWQVCGADTVGTFSAAAYFFGREIFQRIRAPIGLVNSSVGGTAIESWTSMDVQKGRPEFKPVFERWEKAQAAWNPEQAAARYEKQQAAFKETAKKAKEAGKAARAPQKPVEPRLDRNYPANLFNGKIAPLIPYAIRGAIWYQGENNAGSGLGGIYDLLLANLVNDWRSRWGYEFPFAWVQLPNFRKPVDDPVQTTGWVLVREGMLKTLKLPRTGMAITVDVGEAGDIHPKDKQTVGKRLAMWALADVYQQKGVAASGPLPAGHEVRGGEVVLSFTHADGGLTAKGGELKGFAIAGADKKWVKASAKISSDKIIVSSPDVKSPVAVRYAWAENPDCNLYNGAGIPASPFRTDSWE